MTHMRTLAKPAKGTAQKLRRARRRLVETRERAAKDAAKARDIYCRFPGCGRSVGLHAMHLIDAGMGGDGGVYSSEQKHFAAGCAEHHTGRRSVHSTHIEMRFSRDHMADGWIAFWVRDTVPGEFRLAGYSCPPRGFVHGEFDSPF